MKMKRTCFAMLGAAVVLAPLMAVAQIDPNVPTGTNPFPQSNPGAPAIQTGPGATTGTSPAQGQSASMRDSLGAPGETGQQMLDKQFVRTAAEGGIADTKLGTLATQKGSPAVKGLAQKMIDDHTAMNKELDNVADAIGVMLPKKMNKVGQSEYDKLNALSGKDFDTEYLGYMAKVHYEDLHNFHMEASVAANPDLATEVVKDMGMMHQHLVMITNVAKDEGIALPPRPKPAPTTASK